MRAILYTNLDLHRRHPVLEIDPSVPQGAAAYEAFYGYYEELRERVADLPEVRQTPELS